MDDIVMSSEIDGEENKAVSYRDLYTRLAL